MREGGSSEAGLTSPRGSVVSRPKSVREVYHPAVQDLSEQAARNGSVNQEESILSVVSPCTPRSSRPGTEVYSDKFHSPTPILNHFSPEEVVKSSPTAQLCFNQHNNEYLEDLHRQRVLVSAHHRRKLSHVRRSRSTPITSSVNGSASFDFNSHRHSTHEEDPCKLELVVTNGMKMDEKSFKERINYRLTSRTKPKSAHGGLMANGAPLPLLNGYSQTLIQAYPKYSQRYCNWLTHGLKVQSFRVKQTQNIEYNRPPPPLLQYLNRPKSLNGRLPAKRGKTHMNFNIVGVQKEVQQMTLDSTTDHQNNQSISAKAE